jgi:hypothetical protein
MRTKNETNAADEAKMVSAIKSLHSQVETAISDMKAAGAKAIKAAIECGKLLIEQHERVGKKGFSLWLPVCDFSYATANRYMRLARMSKGRKLDEAKSLREAYQMCHIIGKAKAKANSQGKADTEEQKAQAEFEKRLNGDAGVMVSRVDILEKEISLLQDELAGLVSDAKDRPVSNLEATPVLKELVPQIEQRIIPKMTAFLEWWQKKALKDSTPAPAIHVGIVNIPAVEVSTTKLSNGRGRGRGNGAAKKSDLVTA